MVTPPEDSVSALPRPTTYRFRGWVRSTTQRAMVWGGLVLVVLAVWSLSQGGTAGPPAARAVGVLALYGALFFATLLKIWWTARGTAVELSTEALEYQPLHGFSRKAIPLEKVLGSGPKPGTHALRLVYTGTRGEEREFFLNLAVVDGRHDLLDRLDQVLAGQGLQPIGKRPHHWVTPGWQRW